MPLEEVSAGDWRSQPFPVAARVALQILFRAPSSSCRGLSVDYLSEARDAFSVEIVERFAANLRRERLARGMTQEGLAEAAELHRTHISLLEQAKRDPKLSTIVKLAHGLDTTPLQLLGGIGAERLPR
jgi:DNA-binding XRE family transcriptional regulator